MTRTYTLKRRAETQAGTRQKIVEAAVALHGSVGPARTTFSMVAERAGVQRHTLYAHFPDERRLLLACSALHLEQSPPPDAEAWRAIRDDGARLRQGLAAVYGWFAENADMAGCVLRDAESHAPTREIVVMRLGPYFSAYNEVLGEGLGTEQRALLHLALNFFAWRTLREAGLDGGEAVETMARAIESAGGHPRSLRGLLRSSSSARSSSSSAKAEDRAFPSSCEEQDGSSACAEDDERRSPRRD